MIVTQRPSDISETIMAQCNNFIAHRLTTDRDKSFLMSLLPENLLGLANLLPSLSQGDALVAGDAVVLPSRIHVDKTMDLPSVDFRFHHYWTQGPGDNFQMETILNNWIHKIFSFKKQP